MNRFLKGFIAVSVLLNLLLAGLVIGQAGRYAMTMPTHHTLQEVTAMVPADKRQHFETTLQPAVQEAGKLRQQIIDARMKMTTLLKAEPFDKTAYLAQMQAIHQLQAKLMQRIDDIMIQSAAEIPPDARIALNDMLHHPPHPPAEAK